MTGRVCEEDLIGLVPGSLPYLATGHAGRFRHPPPPKKNSGDSRFATGWISALGRRHQRSAMCSTTVSCHDARLRRGPCLFGAFQDRVSPLESCGIECAASRPLPRVDRGGEDG